MSDWKQLPNLTTLKNLDCVSGEAKLLFLLIEGKSYFTYSR